MFPTARKLARTVIEKLSSKVCSTIQFAYNGMIMRAKLSDNLIFQFRRPSVPVNLQNQFLAVLVRQADGVSEYRQGRNLECLKRKRARKDSQPEGVSASKKTKIVGSGVPNEAAEARNTGTSVVTSGRAESLDRPIGDATAMEAEGLAAENEAPPSILQHLTIGINEVTRKLESQIKASRQTVVVSDKGSISSESSSHMRIKVVFVCRADVDPPILIDHLPHLVSMCNSSPKLSDFVKLVPLPKGAEFTLASALGLRRVAVLAFDVNR
jgi:ribonuclease P/MRP protein subunit POP3